MAHDTQPNQPGPSASARPRGNVGGAMQALLAGSIALACAVSITGCRCSPESSSRQAAGAGRASPASGLVVGLAAPVSTSSPDASPRAWPSSRERCVEAPVEEPVCASSPTE